MCVCVCVCVCVRVCVHVHVHVHVHVCACVAFLIITLARFYITDCLCSELAGLCSSPSKFTRVEMIILITLASATTNYCEARLALHVVSRDLLELQLSSAS